MFNGVVVEIFNHDPFVHRMVVLKTTIARFPFHDSANTRNTQVPNHFIIRHQKKNKTNKKDKNGVRIRITPPSTKNKTTPTTHGYNTRNDKTTHLV